MNRRIIDLPEATFIANNDYALLENEAEGQRKILASMIASGGGGGGGAYHRPKRIYGVGTTRNIADNLAIPAYPNSDSAGSNTISVVNDINGVNITTDNFIKDLVAYNFRGSGSFYNMTTNITEYSNKNLKYTWGSQSGRCRQYFNIFYVDDLTKIHILSDWTQYKTAGSYEFTLSDDIVDVLDEDDFILDFRNVITKASIGTDSALFWIKRKIEDGKLKIEFPEGSLNDNACFDVRILYVF